MADGVGIMRRSCYEPKEVWKMSLSGGVVLQRQAYVQDCKSLTIVVASFSTMVLGRTIQVMSRHQMYHNTSSVVSLEGSRVKPVRNRFSRWKEENGKGSVTSDVAMEMIGKWYVVENRVRGFAGFESLDSISGMRRMAPHEPSLASVCNVRFPSVINFKGGEFYAIYLRVVTTFVWSAFHYGGFFFNKAERLQVQREFLIHGFHFLFDFFQSYSLSSTLSLPKSCTSHTANKIENLVEYSYIPKSAQISESSYPLLSPYQLYKRPSSFTRNICTLISTRRPHPKEYIQSSRLDHCSLQATLAEQYVTLEIPSELISNWKREGFTHLHLGGIRLILTLHGRKGLPVTARLAMLDTRFKQYQDAVIGTVLTTLHARSVLLTFYPNFNLSLQDLNLPTTLKVQVQIQGAEQISSAKIATLHHQLVYRLQNHALDLPTLEHHSDTLMVLAESDQIPTIIQIPRQIPRHELIKLMPLEWISNYEQFHNNTAPIQTSESMFERRQDGTVRMTFKPPPSAPQEPPRLSFTYSSMITTVQTTQEDMPITGFNSEGYPVYPAKHNGHFLWDAPGSGMCDPNCPCWDDWEEDDDYATTRKKKPKKKKPLVPCHHCDPKPPSDPPPPPAPLPSTKKNSNRLPNIANLRFHHHSHTQHL
ncbi:hypothetical protein KPL71_017474 [Citrus sinensis]|uniref:Uncharacterized protein n=1 Tax=Citrus sinensis TaxID=2711 RepID=A0ACB8JQJ8_CITSI|nr:hypothetical protein KPL71_017474 [Citrus sinensis]